MVLLMSLSVAGLSFLRSVRQSATSFCGVPIDSPSARRHPSVGAGETRNLPKGVAASFALPTRPNFSVSGGGAGPPYPQAAAVRVPLTDWSVNTSGGNTRLGGRLLDDSVISVTLGAGFGFPAGSGPI
jgi:hypothetical protein